MQSETVRIDRPRDGVALVTLWRPEPLNAMTGEIFAGLMGAAARRSGDPSVRAVVLTKREAPETGWYVAPTIFGDLPAVEST